MPKKLKLYIGVIILLGISFVIYTFNRARFIDAYGLVFFLFLSIAAESLAIPTPNQSGGISVGFAIGFTALIVFGVPEASWLASIGIMLRII
ncbi:MAG: hypothetical protein PHF82_08705, partial [Lutispora sp.]|nr:hypothetical protein [Lutispora sp.]